MNKKLIFVFLTILISCSKTKEMKISEIKIDKPSLNFKLDTLEKPSVITQDKCYMLNSPKTKVVCMLPEEYDKETSNYVKMLSIIKQYQIEREYYANIK